MDPVRLRIEDAVQGLSVVPEDLTDKDKAMLAEHTALRNRLHKAYASVSMPAGLENRVRAALDAADAETEEPPLRVVDAPPRPRVIPLRSRVAAMGAVAAAVLLGVGLLWRISDQTTANPDRVFQPELRRVHQANLLRNPVDFVRRSEPELRNHLRKTTGVDPILPPTGEDLKLCGCSAATLFDRTVASYVVVLNGRQRVSVVVVETPLEELNFSRLLQHRGHRQAWCHSGDCEMAATRIDDMTYVAIGEGVRHETLAELLQTIRDAAR